MLMDRGVDLVQVELRQLVSPQDTPSQRDPFVSASQFEHDLFGKPLHTFRALSVRTIL
jgi:hypothetical protein